MSSGAVDDLQTRNPHDVMNLCGVLGVSKATSSDSVSKTPSLVIKRGISRKIRGTGGVLEHESLKHSISDSQGGTPKSAKKKKTN